jgi:glycosyltransferase involved in cell wall biosynthesis
MKIALLTHDISGGSFTNLCTALARGFQEQGDLCEVVVLNASAEEIANYPDITIVTLNVRRTAFSLPATVRYLREHQPDVVLSMPWYFNLVAIWARFLAGASTKVILGEHNIISLEAGIEHRNNLRLRYLPMVMRYIYPAGDGLIAVCKDTITDLTDTLKIPIPFSTSVILNPIDIERIQHLANRPPEHPWFQDLEIPVILTAARLAKQKQLDVLIHAFAQVVKQLPARLMILGEGPLRKELESLCRELQIEEWVSMPGYEVNPYPYMARCGVFVMTSAWEPCGIALQEAMACSAATIVSDAPGGAKDVIGRGEYGMLIPVGDVDALTKALLQLLTQTDLRKHYQQQGHQRSQDFHYRIITEQYLKFLHAIVTPTSDVKDVSPA